MSILDKLPKVFPFASEKSAQEYFFGLDIGLNKVAASVWGVPGKQLNIINISQISYKGKEELIDASNQALDEALGDFQPEPKKILFGIPDNFLQDDSLKEEYLELLKKLVKELDVTPMAYVSTTHALTHLLKRQTGVPPTAILVKVSDPLSVTVVKAGKILGTKEILREGSLAEDIEKALSYFSNVEVLPSKIDIFGSDSSSLEKLKEELLSYNWMSNLPFLHLPKIEVLEDYIGIKAVSLAGASEISPELSYHPIELPSKEDTKPKLFKKATEPGFIEGDITKERNLAEVTSITADDDTLPEKATFLVKSKLSKSLNVISKACNPLKRVTREYGITFGLRNKTFLIPIFLILALLAAYIFLSRAQVTIYIDPKILEKDAQVVADPSIAKVDEANKIIPGKIVETNVSGSGKGSATGKKQIGNSAKGAVVIINGTNQPQNFSQGTVLTSTQGKKYTLDTSVQVASEDAGLNPGKSDAVTLTAQEIGPDSNLKSGGGDYLQVGGLDKTKVEAQVTTDISGGTSQDVTVVTADDQKKLLASVASDLRKKAQDQIQSKLSGDQKVLAEGLDEKISLTNYSKNIGDQASDFSLNLTIHYRGTSYSDNDLKLMVSKLVETNVPEGYTLDLKDTETSADVSKLDKNGKLIFLARFKAKLIPKLDLNKIKGEIKGKPPSEAADLLKGEENVVDVDFQIRPKLPGKLEHLPILSQNISIEVKPK